MTTRTDDQLDELLDIARQIDDLGQARDREIGDLKAQVESIKNRYEGRISDLRARLRTLWEARGHSGAPAPTATPAPQPAASQDAPKKKRAGTLGERITEYLRSCGDKEAELSDIATAAYGSNTSKHRNLTGSTLWRLARQNKVKKLGKSRWGLVN